MLVEVLGAHKLEDRDARHTCFLIDGVLAMDAGSLASSLTADQQSKIKAVLVSHCHFDHIRDLPTLGLATLDSGHSIEVWALPQTLDAIHRNVLNSEIYPDLTESLGSAPAKYKFHALREGTAFHVLSYTVWPISLPHTVPNVGFIVKSDDGGCIGYTGDTGGRLSSFFRHAWCPHLLFVDVSFPSKLSELAKLTEHLTPGMLREELLAAQGGQLRIPQIFPVHVSQYHEQEIADELLHLSAELGQELVLGHEGMLLEVRKDGTVLLV